VKNSIVSNPRASRFAPKIDEEMEALALRQRQRQEEEERRQEEEYQATVLARLVEEGHIEIVND